MKLSYPEAEGTRSLSNKVFKNYQINLGVPFQVKVPLEELFAGLEGAFGRQGEFGGQSDFVQDSFDGGGMFAGFGADSDNDSGAKAEDVLSAANAEAGRILDEARAEGAGIVEAARAEASEIVDSGRREAAAYRAKVIEETAAEAVEIREQAARDGEIEGREEGKAAYENLIADALRIRGEAEADYKEKLAGAEGDALELILCIAKKVVGEEFECNRENLIYMIKDAFLHCSNKEVVILKVSPGDYEYILENQNHILAAVEGLDSMEIKRDLALGPGACLVETPFGNLDAGATTRMAKIEDVFHSLLSAEGLR